MKSTAVSIIVVGLIIAGAIIFSKNTDNKSQISNTGNNEIVNLNNVSIVEGKQIIEITAKGGYTPRISTAKAGIPTILRFTTNGTFDCSASIRIPSKNILQLLPQTGTTDIDLGTTTIGVVNGTCGMGMYPFSVEFK
jgi:plastocyanin domain-containing protein